PDGEEGFSVLLRAGCMAWAVIGLAGAGVVVLYLLGRFSLVVIPVVLAIFPATLLLPVSEWLKRRGLPPSLASFVTLLAVLGVIGGIVSAMVVLVLVELPALPESAVAGIADLEELLRRAPFGFEVGGV